MFKSAATKIAHNTTIPALAGHSDLRPLQDLITAEKTVLVSLQKLRVDLAKAGDALRIWGQGEGTDLGDILTASSAILAHFALALSNYSNLHHTVRDSMKSVRTREEALDDLRRRRRRVGASAEAAEKKLNKMSPEHKNLSVQAEVLNKLREEMRALDGEIIREEAELGDYKRKCTKDWMGFKFGGLVECCEKGVAIGDIGRQIIQCIPEDITQPGLPRAYYNAHGHVGDLVVEAQRVVSQVAFSTNPSGRDPLSLSMSQPAHPTSQGPPAETPTLPTPSLGSELTLGVAMYSPPPGPPPGHVPANRRVSVDELGVHVQPAPQTHSLPTKKEHDPAPPAPSLTVGSAARPPSLSMPYDSGAAQTDENQSLMASIADALSQSHRGFSLEEATPTGSPKPETLAFNAARSVQSEPHGPVTMTNGRAGVPRLPEEKEGQWRRKTTRRSTSPPSLPPGAAPAAVRAWDDGVGGQGEDDTRSDRPASSSARVPFQRLTSSSDRDGEEEEDYISDRKSAASLMGPEGGDGDGKHHRGNALLSEMGASTELASVDGDAAISNINQQDSMPVQGTELSRAASQWRIPRVRPPPIDAEEDDNYYTPPTATAQGEGEGDEDETRTAEFANTQAHSEAAKREVSRAMDELMFTAIASQSLSSSGYATPRGPPPRYVSVVSAAAATPAAVQPTMSVGGTLYDSAPPSPILPPPNPPFANRGRTSPTIEMRRPPVGHHRPAPSLSDLDRRPPSPTLQPPNPLFANRGRSPTVDVRRPAVHRLTISEGGPGMTVSAPSPLVATSGRAVSPTSPMSGSPLPMYRSPPPEYPRPTPPYSTSLMADSSSSLLSGGGGGSGGGGVSPGGTPKTISAAAFRRPQGRVPSGPGPGMGVGTEATMGPADTSPLMLRKPSGSPSPMLPTASGSGSGSAAMVRGRALSVVNPDLWGSDEEEGNKGSHGGESAGYGVGRYVSDLERSE